MLALTAPSVEAGPESGAGGTVRDLVVPPPAAVGPELTLAEARRRLRETGRDALPVMDGRHLVGIVTRAELDRTPDPLADRRRLGEAVRLRVVYCFDDSDPAEAAATMRAAEVDHLAVLDGDVRFLGLLARRDLPPARDAGSPA